MFSKTGVFAMQGQQAMDCTGCMCKGQQEQQQQQQQHQLAV
jgi:hypothetical protein